MSAPEAVFTKTAMKALHAWAHESLDALFHHAASLPQEAFLRPLPAFADKSVRDQLVHIVFVEEVWIRLLQALPVERWTREFVSVSEIAAEKQRVAAETIAYLEWLTEAQLNAPVSQLTPQWSGPARSPAFIVQHIVTHSFHHKGQVAAMCRVLGYPAPDTDLQRG